MADRTVWVIEVRTTHLQWWPDTESVFSTRSKARVEMETRERRCPNWVFRVRPYVPREDMQHLEEALDDVAAELERIRRAEGEPMTCWKVVRERYDHQLVSCCTDGEVQVEYRRGVWATAPYGGLFVFRLQRDAAAFLAFLGDGPFKSLRAVGEEEIQLPLRSFWCVEYLQEVRKAWTAEEVAKPDPWPQGTTVFTRVMLIGDQR